MLQLFSDVVKINFNFLLCSLMFKQHSWHPLQSQCMMVYMKLIITCRIKINRAKFWTFDVQWTNLVKLVKVHLVKQPSIHFRLLRKHNWMNHNLWDPVWIHLFLLYCTVHYFGGLLCSSFLLRNSYNPAWRILPQGQSLSARYIYFLASSRRYQWVLQSYCFNSIG